MATVQFILTVELTDEGQTHSMDDLAELLHDALCAQVAHVFDENGDDCIGSFDLVDPGDVL